MAAIMLLTTDDFYKRLPAFIRLCNVMADDSFDLHTFDPADTAEMTWAITEAMMLYPPEEEEPFTDEIRFYIGHMLNEEGIVDPPDVLRIAMRDVERVDPLGDMADDPDMYQGMYENQQGKSKEIVDMVKGQLQSLFRQLQTLPLTNGDTDELLDRVRDQGLTM